MELNRPTLGTTYQSVLGAVVNALRSSTEKPITQADIAERLGVTVSTWSRIERGESALTLEQLLGVAIFLNLPLSQLFKHVEEQVEGLEKQGVVIATSKETLKEKGVVQLSNSQLISAGFVGVTAIAVVGGALYGAYKALLTPTPK